MNWLKSSFNFTKKELNGLFVLCLLLVSITIFPWIYAVLPSNEKTFDASEFKNQVAAFESSVIKSMSAPNKQRNLIQPSHKAFRPVYTKFDPNKTSRACWKKLGLLDWQIHIIENYKAAGGHFFHKKDLKKIYGLTEKDYWRLEPYIDIPQNANGIKKETKTPKAYPSKIIELNSSDSIQLQLIHGIGPILSARIVKYRDRLGGFYEKKQLREVFGINAEKYQQIQSQVAVNPEQLKKIFINTITFDELKKFPYLSYKQMHVLIRYREQHGPYQNIEDLKNTSILDSVVLNKLKPYLAF